MSLSAIDSYKTFTAEPKMRADASRRTTSVHDTSDPRTHASTRDGHSLSPQRLERALTSALESLKLGATVAQASQTSPATESTSTTDSTRSGSESSIKEAVHEFAHALAQALRSEAHAERGGRGRYAEMSKGLERLAQGTGNLTAEGTPTPTPVPGTGGPSQVPNDDEPTYAGDANGPTKAIMPIKVPPIELPIDPISLTPATDAAASTSTSTSAPAAAATTSSREDRLLSAFTKLFDALQPGAATGGTGTQVDYVAKMRDFLHTLGQALSPNGNSALPTSGGLLNVTA